MKKRRWESHKSRLWMSIFLGCLARTPLTTQPEFEPWTFSLCRWRPHHATPHQRRDSTCGFDSFFELVKLKLHVVAEPSLHLLPVKTPRSSKYTWQHNIKQLLAVNGSTCALLSNRKTKYIFCLEGPWGMHLFLISLIFLPEFLKKIVFLNGKEEAAGTRRLYIGHRSQ